jgi:uncharacterized protein YceH (UPF0502 family)
MLDEPQARVLGCLLEKQLATPQYYPLTLNALVTACNQSSNREPVTSYADAEVTDALDGLREQGLVRVVYSSGNRVPKYRHVLDETWGLDAAHRAVLAVLLLRGPQTPGELRSRTERLASFASLDEIEEVLRLLAIREEPLVRQMDRRPGQKEARYRELLRGGDALKGFESVAGSEAAAGSEALAGAEPLGGSAALGGSAQPTRSLADRVAELEAAVAELEAAVAGLKELNTQLEARLQ